MDRFVPVVCDGQTGGHHVIAITRRSRGSVKPRQPRSGLASDRTSCGCLRGGHDSGLAVKGRMLRRARQRFEYREAHLLSESEAISNSAGEAVDLIV